MEKMSSLGDERAFSFSYLLISVCCHEIVSFFLISGPMRKGSIPGCAEHHRLTELGTEGNIKYPSFLPLISRLCHLLINKEPQCFYILLKEAGGLVKAER